MQPSNTPEEWRPVVGYEGLYEVSSHGLVRGVDRYVIGTNGRRLWKGRTLKTQSHDRTGHPRLSLCSGGRPVTHFVHTLVCEAFHGARPPGGVTRHLNGVPSDNRAENLAWGTVQDNIDDRDAHGTTVRGEQSWNVSLNESVVREVRRLRSLGFTYPEITDATGVEKTHAWQIVKRKIWAHVDPPVARHVLGQEADR